MGIKLKQKLAINYIRARLNILSLVSARKAAEKAFDLFCTPMQRSRNETSAAFDKGEKLSFRLEGHIVRGHRWRPHQASTATLKKVLIAHGFESSSGNYDRYVSALLKKGYEVLAFDAPAHGGSGGKKITLPLYVKTLETILELYGPVDSFLGHSFGGLALCMLLESTGSDPATKLVLIAPVCEMTTAVDSFFFKLQFREEMRKEFDELSYELYGQDFSYFSIRRALYQIGADILWMQDEDDQVTPMRDLLPVKADRHPHVRFVITSGLGHRKIYRDPAVLQQVVEFL
jgi:pimeloyl-ACP methyl ester carboxylesterase